MIKPFDRHNQLTKHRATLYVREHPCLINDAIFSGEPMEGMKSDAFMFIELKHQLAKYGIILSTQHMHDPAESVFIICVDNVLPRHSLKKKRASHGT